MATETKTTDSSVVMALSELVRMESARIESDREREEKRLVEERVERERAIAAAQEAERQRIERAAQEQRVADAEARLRVEADRERDQRIAAMKAELARVEADRQALRAGIEERVNAREPARPNGWALAFGLSSLVAASLAGLLVMQTGAHDVAPIAQPAPLVVITQPARDDAPEIAVAPAPQPELETVAAAPAATPHHVRHDRVHAQIDTRPHPTDLHELDDDGGDDVLGHLADDAHHALHR